jgi:pyruvate-ferredoxin/flavodoxin oxidoreductase
MTGLDAVLDAAAAAGEIVVVDAPRDDDELVSSSAAGHAPVTRTAEPREILPLLTGLVLQGARASGIVTHAHRLADHLAAASGRRLAMVVHLAGRSRTRHAASLQGSHDEYHALADTGAFLMFARNVQQAADFSFIARLVAERSLTPGVCAQDLFETSHSIQSLERVNDALARELLGRSDDVVRCPSEAQSIVFGENRRRVPVLLDVDRPAGIGGVQDAESYFRAVAAQRPFFAAPLATVMDDAMREFGERTGRFHARVFAYRVDDAEWVVVGQGALMEALIPVVDHLRGKKHKVGLVDVSVLRPFDGEALSHMLAGKRGVAVLERADSPLADAPPLFQEVRGAVDRATENGRTPDATPYPGHASFRRVEDRPPLFSGSYGIGGELPSFGDLVAVFEHMSTRGASRRFHLGARFVIETRRFPHLETLQQRLTREYPALETMSLTPSTARAERAPDGGAFELRSLSVQGGLPAANLFAQVLRAALGWDVRTFPNGGLEHSLQPVRVTTTHGMKAAARSQPVELDAVMISGGHMLEALCGDATVRRGGALVIGSVLEPDALWRGLSPRAADWVRSGDFRVHLLDARKIATETAAHASFIDQLAVWSLLGACARCSLGLDAATLHALAGTLRTLLAPRADSATVEMIEKSFLRGAEEAREMEWKTWTDVAHTSIEPDAPWTVRGGARHDGTAFDPVRFWNSVGFLYDRELSAFTLADPYLSTGILPARSSAFRDVGRYRLRIPVWIPSACTGCAACWSLCPESAMPAAVRPVSEWIDAATRECEQNGGALVQMKRTADALAKQAYRLAREKAPQPYESLGALLTDAFARVVEKAGLPDDRLGALRNEFDRLCAAIDRFPVAVTERFFQKRHDAASGTGRLLSIAINPTTCTACGVCVASCPDGALAWADPAPERTDRDRRDWNFLTRLPALPAGAGTGLVGDDDPDPSLLRLLDMSVYHSLVGGDGSFPGNGAKVAAHLVTAAVESEMRPRYAAHVERLSRLIERIEQQIQGNVDSTAKINDFEEFARRLSRVADGAITPDVLRSLASDGPAQVDAARLERLTTLLRGLKEQLRSYTEGDGRARMVLVIDPTEGSFWNGTYPYNPHAQPWVAHLPGDAAALARGVRDGLVDRLAADVALVRRAETELDRQTSEPPARALAWNDLTADERRLLPAILVLADAERVDGPGLAGLLEGDVPVRVVLIDHDGIAFERGTGAARRITLSALRSRGHAFVLQSSIGYPGHLMNGVIESMKSERPALYRLYAPDAVRDGLPAESIVEAARLAVDGRVVPLFTAGPEGLSLDANPDFPADWTSSALAVREPSGGDGEVRTTVTPADWAAGQARFRRHFTVVSRGNRSAQMKPLAEFLALAPDARGSIQPYIDVRDREGRHALALMSAEMVDAAQRCADAWRELCDWARRPAAPEAAPIAAEAAVSSAPARLDATAVQTLAENLLRLSGYGSDETFFRRRLREFVSQAKNADGAAE